MDCSRVAAEEIAERYLLDRLTEPDRDAFEAHFFECFRCFSHLQMLQSVQSELARTASTSAAEPKRAPRMPTWIWAAAAALLMAAGLGFWQMRRIDDRTTDLAGTTATLPRPPQPGSADRAGPNAARLAELARVDPPPYLPLTMRSADELRIGVEQAMAAYAAGRYAEAATGLEAVVSRQPAAVGAQFFLGISYLMLDRTDEGISALRRCLAAGDTVYAQDALFFLGKALLRKGDREAAVRALDAVARANGPRSDEARALQAALAALER